MSRVPFQRPRPAGIAAIAAHYAHSEEIGWYTRGPAVALLGERVAALAGAAHGVPVSSATSGIMVALRALAGAPDRRRLVIVPSFTCAAVAGAVEWAGFTPLFVDVERAGWHPDPAAVADALAEHGGAIAAVLAAATFGTPPAPGLIDAWTTAARDAGVPLLFDAAAGLGSTGAAGRVTAYSFEATKPSGAGEGGVMVTDDAELADTLRRLANYGVQGTVVADAVGLNAKLSELGAAAALATLDGLADALAARRARGAALAERLTAAGAVLQDGAVASSWDAVHVVLETAEAREAAVARARELDVEVRTLWDPPLHRQPAWAGSTVPRFGLAATEDLASRSLALPMAADLSEDEAERVARVVTG
ncbi:MAG TPA: DegT/DnrJ/EryC1/StrS family aminotransferase [Baekduia sp.]|jgi:dTDP-4-amino-4,6-dideoxygalactose transaminase